jgi:hypothetical protein
MTHMFQGTVSLELARQVAKTLHASPALLAIGRDNLENCGHALVAPLLRVWGIKARLRQHATTSA